MLIKHAILEESHIAESGPFSAEDIEPLDEIDDLLELPTNPELLSDIESVTRIDSSDEEPQTPSRRLLPPRKKLKPTRYRN